MEGEEEEEEVVACDGLGQIREACGGGEMKGVMGGNRWVRGSVEGRGADGEGDQGIEGDQVLGRKCRSYAARSDGRAIG